MHFVCTWSEAEDLVAGTERFFVANCACREGRGGCGRSRMDVCLSFDPGFALPGSGAREATPEDARQILREMRLNRLVARPFRNEDRSRTVGCCFCCDDCCEYFRNPAAACDKGAFEERTDADRCQHCGSCAGACRFGARVMEDDGGRLAVRHDACYGCGICTEYCPTGSIRMVPRT